MGVPSAWRSTRSFVNILVNGQEGKDAYSLLGAAYWDSKFRLCDAVHVTVFLVPSRYKPWREIGTTDAELFY